jgi:hypothetical protein
MGARAHRSPLHGPASKEPPPEHCRQQLLRADRGLAHANKLSLALCVISLIAVPVASASEFATLKVALTPERLGGRTTIAFAFHIIPHDQPVPSPLVAVNVFYPESIGIVTSGLGTETCASIQLEVLGRCPPNSLLGYGTALVKVPFGPELISEQGRITTWLAPTENGHPGLLFLAVGGTPVQAEVIFTARLLAAPFPYAQLAITTPLIPSLPEGPDASVVEMTSTIGPMNVTYYAWFRGKRTPYHPDGLGLPDRCPRGGFPFAATFAFQDGTRAEARTAVPCPEAGGRRRRQRRARMKAR